jgi:hypothetical protein
MRNHLLIAAAILALTVSSAMAQMSDYEWHHPTAKTASKEICDGKLEKNEGNPDWLDVGGCLSGGDKEITEQMRNLCRMGEDCKFIAWISPHEKIRKIITAKSGHQVYSCKGFARQERQGILSIGVNEASCEAPKDSDVGEKIAKACGNDFCSFFGIGPDHLKIERVEGPVSLVAYHCHGTLTTGDVGIKIVGSEVKDGDDDVCASIGQSKASYVLDDEDAKLLLRICKNGDICDFDLGLHNTDGTFIVGRIRNAGVQQHETSSSNPSPPLDFISKDVTACPTIAEVTQEGCDGLGTLKLKTDQPVFVHKRVSPDGEHGPKFACVSNANFGRCYWLSADHLTGETPVFGPVHHGRATCSQCRE